MVNFIIAGQPNCPNFVHAAYVADILHKKLPDFTVKLIQLEENDWRDYLRDINQKFHWNHSSSPLIYKELLYHGGKPHYVGSLSDFWEYCYDYYNLQSILPEEQLENLIKDNMEHFNMIKKESDESSSYRRNILIYGGTIKFLSLLLPELFKIEGLGLENGIQPMLYDDNVATDDEARMLFGELMTDIRRNFNCKIEIVEALHKAIEKTDLLIYLEDPMIEQIGDIQWTKTKAKLLRLADILNVFAQRDLRIIFANNGPNCFQATYLYRKTDHACKSNIVALTSDIGLMFLRKCADVLELNLEKLGAPPIWGCIGKNYLVDLESIVKKCNIYKPYERAMRATEKSTLIQGTVITELRFIGYLTAGNAEFDKLSKETSGDSEVPKVLNYAKVRSLVSLLKLWYAPKPVGNVISLGVAADGTFGLNGDVELIFSQPCTLKNGRWKPCENFPVQSDTLYEIQRMFTDSLKIYKSILSEYQMATF